MGVVYKINFVGSDGIYIGSTNNLVRRQQRHIKSLRARKHHNRPLQRAFKKYGETAMTFSVVIYTHCSNADLVALEQHAIDTARSDGAKLYNTSLVAGRPAGMKGMNHSNETRLAMSNFAKSIGRRLPDTPEIREKMRKVRAAKRKPKQLSILFGRVAPVSEETRKKMSETHKRRYEKTPRSPETCAKLSASKMGHAVSEEVRRKISEAQKRRLSEPGKRAKCATRAGTKQTEETKAKIRAGQLAFRTAQRAGA